MVCYVYVIKFYSFTCWSAHVCYLIYLIYGGFIIYLLGLKKASGTGGTNMDVLLQVSNVVKDIRVGMLSDDKFSEVRVLQINLKL